MAQELEKDTYDVVVLGTGLAESIVAAALAKVGKSVLHLDPNEYYAAEQASLTLDEFKSWADERNGSDTASEPGPSDYTRAQKRRYSRATTTDLSPELERDKRRYALSLYPAVLPSRGLLISTLVASNVSKYVGFRLLDSVGLWQAEGSVRKVPGSKEEVFKDKTIGLADKRKLMKFLMWVAGEFEDDPVLQGKTEQPLAEFLKQSFSLAAPLAEQITFAIAHASSLYEPALPALLRTRRYLRSIGRYGAGAFLVGQYGGAGEVAQGFCRACAVKGGTYVLGSQGVVQSIEVNHEDVDLPIKLSVACQAGPVRAKNIISNTDYLPPNLLTSDSSVADSAARTTAHIIAVLPSLPAPLRRGSQEGVAVEGGSTQDMEQDDTAVVVFPPEEDRGLVRALLMGDGTGSCPPGQYILYLWGECSAETDPRSFLQPYLDRLHASPLFIASYLSRTQSSPASSPGQLGASSSAAIVVLRPYEGGERLTEGLDWEAEQGEAAFWAVMGGKPAAGSEAEPGSGFFEKEEGDDEPDMDD